MKINININILKHVMYILFIVIIKFIIYIFKIYTRNI